MLAVLVTGAMLFCQLVGVFDGLERASIDLRYRYARWWKPEPMSAHIVHVDIDDGSLETEERWPWPRSKIAMVLDELRLAGARTIALDLLLNDESPTTTIVREDGTTGLIDHDQVLAAAFDQANCAILGVDVLDDSPVGDDWMSAVGQAELARLMSVLESNIRADAEAAARQAGLSEPRLSLFLRRSMDFKKVAAWSVLRELREHQSGSVTFPELLARVAPNVDAFTGTFPERTLLERMHDQHRSWVLMQKRGMLIGEETRFAFHKAPRAAFTEAAAGVGHISALIDADGTVRQLPVERPGITGVVAQMGVAAAAHWLGVPMTEVEVQEDRLSVGTHVFPLNNGRLLVDWNRPVTGWLDDDAWIHAGQQSAEDPPTRGHLSIGAIKSLAGERTRLQALVNRHAALSHDLGEAIGVDPTTDQGQQEIAFDVRMNVVYPLARSFLERSENLSRDEKVSTFLSEAAGYEHPPPEIRAVISHAAGQAFEDLQRAGEDEALLREMGARIEWDRLDEAIRDGRDVLAEQSAALRSQVEGKLVFIGWIATGALADFVSTPLGPRTPGVMVHSTIASMILTGESRALAPAWMESALLLLIGCGIGLATAGRSPLSSTMIAGLVLVVFAGVAAIWSFTEGRVIQPVVTPVMTGALVWISGIGLEAWLGQRERRRIMRQFKARVSSDLVDFLIEHPDSVSMGGEQREMTVFFLDLAGFTAISEKLDGPATVSILNRCMQRVTNRLTEANAYVNKFLGDGVMSFWSAFQEDADQAKRACEAALACQQEVDALNDLPEFSGLSRLSSRIGIATGRVVVGDCGAPPELNDYTVIGDSVNLAARLESANKQFGTRILIDGRTHDLLGEHLATTRFIGRIIVVGQTRPVDTYEVVSGERTPGADKLQGRAIMAFRDGDYPLSESLWKEYVETYGSCRLAEIYIEQIEGASDTCDGVIRLRDK